MYTARLMSADTMQSTVGTTDPTLSGQMTPSALQDAHGAWWATEFASQSAKARTARPREAMGKTVTSGQTLWSVHLGVSGTW